MRILSSAVFLVLLLGSCGLKSPIYIPNDPSLCLGCSKDLLFKEFKKEKSKVERQKKPLDKEESKVEGQEESLDKEKFKYIPKVKGQKN